MMNKALKARDPGGNDDNYRAGGDDDDTNGQDSCEMIRGEN
jgi:hypothetical protein